MKKIYLYNSWQLACLFFGCLNDLDVLCRMPQVETADKAYTDAESYFTKGPP